MQTLLILIEISILLLFSVAAYFLITTRFSIFLQSLYKPGASDEHIYWLYSNRFLIWLTDRKPIISAILLFNYNRLVDGVLRDVNPSLEGKDVLQTTCAFGDISERLMGHCLNEGARRLVIFDLLPNQVKHTRKKLARRFGPSLMEKCRFSVEDAMEMSHPASSFDYVVSFFLLHELPFEKKAVALKESARVVKVGGRIVFGEFHRPGPWLLRFSGRWFFKVFEPYAHQMWGRFDPERTLNEDTPYTWETKRSTYFFGNYQVFSARRLS